MVRPSLRTESNTADPRVDEVADQTTFIATGLPSLGYLTAVAAGLPNPGGVPARSRVRRQAKKGSRWPVSAYFLRASILVAQPIVHALTPSMVAKSLWSKFRTTPPSGRSTIS